VPSDATYPPSPEPLPGVVADSHCHLDIARTDDVLDVAAAIAAARAVGVTRIVQVGCDLPGARWAVHVAQQHAALVAAVALHPNEAPRLYGTGEFDAAWLEVGALASDPVVRAVGETGLDYYRTPPEGRARQEESFRLHVALSKQLEKTLVIHDRDAHDAVLRVLDDEGAPDRVVMHCFSGDPAFAQACVERGYVLSFAGTVTFANSETLRQAATVVPTDQLLVETDAPYLTPVPYRGRPNASYLIPLTLAVLARVRDQPLADLCASVDATTDRMFGPWGG
jgi:TatD DNase family protein